MSTTEEIRNDALRRLGVLGRGQTARSEDAESMDAAYVEVHAYLEELGLTPWGDETADVPSRFVFDVVSLTAVSRATEFSLSQVRFQRVAAFASGAEQRIRRLLVTEKNKPTEIEYF